MFLKNNTNNWVSYSESIHQLVRILKIKHPSWPPYASRILYTLNIISSIETKINWGILLEGELLDSVDLNKQKSGSLLQNINETAVNTRAILTAIQDYSKAAPTQYKSNIQKCSEAVTDLNNFSFQSLELAKSKKESKVIDLAQYRNLGEQVKTSCLLFRNGFFLDLVEKKSD
eukprot:TRINITY_DN610_c0_g1_i9.p1 TRINITY_DN610_c0_g1~~TRINITY_DN610_c0_g1_i9.p1  ORF type:complete len:173 (+),score=10.61 TRINITY_DN610_c0_g1_i9:268-786(+)